MYTRVCVCVLNCVQFVFNPMDCSPVGSSVHGISQARILTWVAISFSKRGLLLVVNYPFFFFPPEFIPCFISLFGASKKKQNKQTFLVIVPFCCWYFIPIPSHCGFLHVLINNILSLCLYV